MRNTMMTLIISPGLARPSLMSVVPKLNAVYRWARISELVGGQETELTKTIGTVHDKEKGGKAHALGDCHAAIHVVGLLDGNIIQGREYTLNAESLSRTDRRHNFLREGSAFGNIL
jgi:hypothetical protein